LGQGISGQHQGPRGVKTRIDRPKTWPHPRSSRHSKITLDQRLEEVIIAGSVSDEEAKKTYPQGWKAPRPYLRIVPQPRG
jgi:hypothetical protein